MKITEILFWLALSGFLLFSAAAVYFYRMGKRKRYVVRITGKGLAVVAVLSSVYESEPDEREYQRRVLARYCEYIAANGYKSGAEAALAEIDALEDDNARLNWLEDTYRRYVRNDDELFKVLDELVDFLKANGKEVEG